jgi:hypothetical protein
LLGRIDLSDALSLPEVKYRVEQTAKDQFPWDSALALWRASPQCPRNDDMQYQPASFRATVEKDDRKYWSLSTAELSGILGACVGSQHPWPVSLKAFELNVIGLAFGAPQRCLIVGVDLTGIEKASHRCHVAFGLTSLQPAIAAGMVRLAQIEPQEVVLDPMCGSGTIPIEALYAHDDVHVIGADVYPPCIHNSIQNISAFAPAKRVDLLLSCATSLPLPTGSIDRVIVDLPWGMRFWLCCFQ